MNCPCSSPLNIPDHLGISHGDVLWKSFDRTLMITMKTSIDMIRAKLKNPPTVNIIEENKSKLTHRIQYKELKDRYSPSVQAFS
ncbi:MAG: hypothetical protein QXE66_06715 [Desulfurococcaceae archaeon]